MTHNLFDIRGITCNYGSTNVIEDISLKVERGDLLGILGPNASGKTTLIRACSGLLIPRSGNIVFEGRDLYSMGRREIARKIAVVPQNTQFDPSFSVFDMVLMGRSPHLGWLETEDREDLEIARDMMRLLSIEKISEKRMGEVSGGQVQKVLIARALTQQPSLLLLDEPTTHLDISNEIGTMDLIKGLCLEEELAVMAVFHDLNLTARYCNHALLLKEGKQMASGEISQVIQSRTIRKTFGIEVEVRKHPMTQSIFIVPISNHPKVEGKQSARIHIVCGGGTGSNLMRELTRRGYRMTTGVLNVLDTDNETANELGIPVINEAPFSPISEENHQRHLNAISSSELVILSEVPFGKGNIRNLEAVSWALKKGKRILIIEGESEERDFTEGRAQRYLTRLRKRGVEIAQTEREALSKIDNILSQEQSTVRTQPYCGEDARNPLE